MKRGGPTRLGIILIVLVFAAVIVGAIVWAGQGIFSGKAPTDSLSSAQKLLEKSNSQTSIKMVVRGPITAQENHYSISAQISASSRNLTVLQGYSGQVVVNQNFANSSDAFNDMMAVLNREGFMSSQSTNLTTAGICADGQVLNFQIFDGSRKVGDLWSDSCGDSGTFAGSSSVISTILGQIPNSSDTIANAKAAIGANDAEANNPFAL